MKPIAIVSHPIGRLKPVPDFSLAMEANNILFEENDRLRLVATAAHNYLHALPSVSAVAREELFKALQEAGYISEDEL